MIEYYGFKRGIHNRVIEEEDPGKSCLPEDYMPELYLKKASGKTGLNDPFHQDYPRYIQLSFCLDFYWLFVNQVNDFLNVSNQGRYHELKGELSLGVFRNVLKVDLN